MVFIDTPEIPTASSDDLRRARTDAKKLMGRLLGVYATGVIEQRYDPARVVKAVSDTFGNDIPTQPPHIVDAIGEALEALCEPYDATTEAKVERAYNLIAHSRAACMIELIRRREPLDRSWQNSPFIF